MLAFSENMSKRSVSTFDSVILTNSDEELSEPPAPECVRSRGGRGRGRGGRSLALVGGRGRGRTSKGRKGGPKEKLDHPPVQSLKKTLSSRKPLPSLFNPLHLGLKAVPISASHPLSSPSPKAQPPPSTRLLRGHLFPAFNHPLQHLQPHHVKQVTGRTIITFTIW